MLPQLYTVDDILIACLKEWHHRTQVKAA